MALLHDTWWLPIVLLSATVIFTCGRWRVARIKWISIPWGITALCSLIYYLVLPHFHVSGNFTNEQIVGLTGTFTWLAGLWAAWRLQSETNQLTKEIEQMLDHGPSAGTTLEEHVERLRLRLESLHKWIAPGGIAPNSGVTVEWVEARLQELAAQRTLAASNQPPEIAGR